MNARTRETMFSSKTDMWETPQDFFDKLDDEFHFSLDAAADCGNAKCPVYFDVEANSLKQDWTDLHHYSGAVWLNPPYGRGIGAWVKKAYETSVAGRTVVCLLPARTDTQWFHGYCLLFGEVRFIRGRLKFGGAKNSAPFPSMVVIFRGGK